MNYDDFDGVEPTTPLELALGHLRTLAETTELLVTAALQDDGTFMCAQLLQIELSDALKGLRQLDGLWGELAGRASSPDERRRAVAKWGLRRGA